LIGNTELVGPLEPTDTWEQVKQKMSKNKTKSAQKNYRALQCMEEREEGRLSEDDTACDVSSKKLRTTFNN
jgi:hypothetical protein